MVNLRKLVAFDMAVHSPRFIVTEFVIGALGIPALGVFSISRGGMEMGLYLLSIGTNYMPLLIYAVIIAMKKSAMREAAYELGHKTSALVKSDPPLPIKNDPPTLKLSSH